MEGEVVNVDVNFPSGFRNVVSLMMAEEEGKEKGFVLVMLPNIE